MNGDEREQLAEGTLITHLMELRDRLLRAVLAVKRSLDWRRVLSVEFTSLLPRKWITW